MSKRLLRSHDIAPKIDVCRKLEALSFLIILAKTQHYGTASLAWSPDWRSGSQRVNAIIEIPKGSRAKYEIDKGERIDQTWQGNYASMYYPLNYGFIPQTLGEDKDPLDIVVLTQVSVVPRCLIPSKVIGVMRMIDRGEPDDKIIAVAEQDASVSHIRDVSNCPSFSGSN